MSALIFVDTNVVVYRFDSTEPSKQRAAQEWLGRLWASRSGRVSTQVLHEVYVTLTRKLDLPTADGRQIVRALDAWDPVVLTHGIVERAWNVEDRWSLSWWDALIVAAALAVRADILLTEDLKAGQDFEGVKVVNPFVTPPEEILPA